MQLHRPLENLHLSPWQADISLLIITAIWGWTFLVMKDVISVYPVFSFLSLRFALALLVLLPLVWPRLRTLSWVQARAGLITGLFLFAGYSLQTVGLKYTSIPKSGFITGLYVVLVPILATVFLRRVPSRSAAIGLFLATMGLIRLSLGPDLSIGVGDFLTLIGAVAYAAHVISVSKFGHDTDPMTYAALQIATVFVGTFVLASFLDGPSAWEHTSVNVLQSALLTGIVATALVLVLQATAQRFTSPTRTAVVFTMEPVFAALFGIAFAGERLTGSGWLGAGLILVGMLMAEVGDVVFRRRPNLSTNVLSAD
jgi:drug/metabolite transporter (DMT)-like permease